MIKILYYLREREREREEKEYHESVDLNPRNHPLDRPLEVQGMVREDSTRKPSTDESKERGPEWKSFEKEDIVKAEEEQLRDKVPRNNGNFTGEVLVQPRVEEWMEIIDDNPEISLQAPLSYREALKPKENRGR